MPARDQAAPQLEHQPYAAASAGLAADVVMDERDVHLREPAVLPSAAPGPFALRRDVDGPISSAGMVSMLPADGDPALDGSSQDPPRDILDTTDAGPTYSAAACCASMAIRSHADHLASSAVVIATSG